MARRLTFANGSPRAECIDCGGPVDDEKGLRCEDCQEDGA